MTIDFTTYTNAALVAVNPATLVGDDLQDYREEMQDRGLSGIAPPAVPATPAPIPTPITLQSPGGIGWLLTVDDDGSLRTTRADDASQSEVSARLPIGIVDGQILVYDTDTARMLAGQLPGTKVVPGDALTEDTSADLPLNAEDNVAWVQTDTLPDWLSSDDTDETLTNEANTLALTQG